MAVAVFSQDGQAPAPITDSAELAFESRDAGPLAVSPVTQDVSFVFRGPHFEVLRIRVVPAILNSVDVMDIRDAVLSNRYIQGEGQRPLVGSIAGVGFDVDGEGHDQILNDRTFTENLSNDD